MICKYFLPFCGLYFHFLDGFLCRIIVCNQWSIIYIFSFFTCDVLALILHTRKLRVWEDSQLPKGISQINPEPEPGSLRCLCSLLQSHRIEHSGFTMENQKENHCLVETVFEKVLFYLFLSFLFHISPFLYGIFEHILIKVTGNAGEKIRNTILNFRLYCKVKEVDIEWDSIIKTPRAAPSSQSFLGNCGRAPTVAALEGDRYMYIGQLCCSC